MKAVPLSAAPAAVREALPAWRQAVREELALVQPLSRCGRVVEARGTLVRVAGLAARIGDLCELQLADQSVRLAEVIGLADDCALLMPHGELTGLGIGVAVQPLGQGHRIAVGDGLLGRVLDGLGRPIDGRGPLACTRTAPGGGGGGGAPPPARPRPPPRARRRAAPPPPPPPTRWRAARSTDCSRPACAPSTRSRPWARASAWACSRRLVWARARWPACWRAPPTWTCAWWR